MKFSFRSPHRRANSVYYPSNPYYFSPSIDNLKIMIHISYSIRNRRAKYLNCLFFYLYSNCNGCQVLEDNEDSIPDSHSFMMYDGGLCVGYPQKHIIIPILIEIANKDHVALYSKLILWLSCLDPSYRIYTKSTVIILE